MKHYRVLLHERGPALWPEYIDLAALEDARRESGTPVFNTMYQGDPGGLTGQIIRRDFFRYDYPPEASECFATLDPAISSRTSADETALVVGNIDDEGTIYIRFVWHGRVGIMDQERLIVGMWEHYRPQTIGIETVAYQAALVQLLLDRHPELPVEGIPQEKDKFTRLLALAALYEFGRVVHHPALKNSAFEQQLTHLPASKHDDMGDAAAMLTTYADSGAGIIEKPSGAR
jgi:predicted phage terminase large subunit-like protein